MKLIVEKLQHQKRINLYITYPAGNQPDIQLTNQQVLLTHETPEGILEHVKDMLTDDDLTKLSIRLIHHRDESGKDLTFFEFTQYAFDCEVDSEEANLMASTDTYMVLTIPIDEDKIAKSSVLTEYDNFPTSYELDSRNYPQIITSRCCGRAITSGKHPIGQVLALPSNYWQEQCDIWFCHNKKASLVTAERHDVEVRAGRYMLGEGYVLIHSDDLLPIGINNTDNHANMNDNDNPNVAPNQLHILNLPSMIKNLAPVEYMSHVGTVQSPLLAVYGVDRQSSGQSAVKRALEAIREREEFYLHGEQTDPSKMVFEEIDRVLELCQRLPFREFFPLSCACGAVLGECEVVIREKTSTTAVPNVVLSSVKEQLEQIITNVEAVPTGTVKQYKHALVACRGDQTTHPLKSHEQYAKLPDDYNLFSPYQFESLVSAALLAAGHAHVGYRFHIEDYEQTQSIQIMVLNWDVYIRMLNTPVGGLSKEGREKALQKKGVVIEVDPTPVTDASTLVPAAKLLWRQASTDSDINKATFNTWATIMGAQYLKWPLQMINDLSSILQHRQEAQPTEITAMTGAKGFSSSYLVRMNSYKVENVLENKMKN